MHKRDSALRPWRLYSGTETVELSSENLFFQFLKHIALFHGGSEPLHMLVFALTSAWKALLLSLAANHLQLQTVSCYKAMEMNVGEVTFKQKLEGEAGHIRRKESSVTSQKGSFASPESERRCYDWCKRSGSEGESQVLQA